MDAVKICVRCQQARLATPENFSRNKRKKDGLDPWCKGCSAAYAASYYLRNQEKLKGQTRTRYWADPSAALKREKARLEADPDAKRRKNEADRRRYRESDSEVLEC